MDRELADRIKGYENVYRQTLEEGKPFVIRVDGRAFHTYTKDCVAPFDIRFHEAMDNVGVALCEEIQGAVMAYIFSDEVSILVNPRKTPVSTTWFDGNTQKIASIAAACATSELMVRSINIFGEMRKGLFDARVFAIPSEEIANYFVWRQQDAIRNSIHAMARANYSHRELLNKSSEDMKHMLIACGKPWDVIAVRFKRGRTIVKTRGDEVEHSYVDKRNGKMNTVKIRENKWRADINIGNFATDSAYITDRFSAESSVI